MMDDRIDDRKVSQPGILIAWAIASVFIALLFFMHPARAPYWQRVATFIQRVSN